MIAQHEIVDHVTHLIGSDSLRSSPSLIRLLQFCVDKALAGENDNLKESTIGILCFGRTPGYDTKADPIVRVSARRLRAKLNLFYESEGTGSTVRVNIPKGTYVPVFGRPNVPLAITVPSEEPVPSWVQQLAVPTLVQRSAASGVWSVSYSFFLVLLAALVFSHTHRHSALTLDADLHPSSQRTVCAPAKSSPSTSREEGASLPLSAETSVRVSSEESSSRTPLLASEPHPVRANGDRAAEALSHGIRKVEASANQPILATNTRVSQQPLILSEQSPNLKAVVLERIQDDAEARSRHAGQPEMIASGRSTLTHFWTSERYDDVDHSAGPVQGHAENTSNGLSSTFEPHF
jgi:hypothetical protein